MIRKILPYLLLTLLSIAVYLNSLKAEFVFDDLNIIVNNRLIREIDIGKLWESHPLRFVGNLSFAANYKIGELNVFWYHLTNVVIHTLSGLSVYIFLKLLIKTPLLENKSKIYKKLPFLASLIFLLHPVQTQAVTYVTQRLSSLTAFLYTVSLIFFLKTILESEKSMKPAKYYKLIIFFISSTLFTFLAFITKENSFTLPIMFITLTLFFFPSSLNRIFRRFTFALPSLAVGIFVAFSGLVKYSDLKSLNLFNSAKIDPVYFLKIIIEKFSLSYLLTQLKVIVYYLKLYILPVNQNLDYDFPMSSTLFEKHTFFSLIIIVALITTAIIIRKKFRLISFGMLFFFSTLSIESSIFPLDDVIYEHRMYLPLLGLSIASTAIYSEFRQFFVKRKKLSPDSKAAISRIILTAFFGGILLLSVLTIARNQIWNTKVSLWLDTVNKSPNKARPHNNLALAYAEKKQYTDGIFEIKRAIKIEPTSARYVNLGNIYTKVGRYQDAIAAYEKAVELNPENYGALNLIGNLLIIQKKTELAKNYFDKSLKINPQNPEALKGLVQITKNCC